MLRLKPDFLRDISSGVSHPGDLICDVSYLLLRAADSIYRTIGLKNAFYSIENSFTTENTRCDVCDIIASRRAKKP
jgi:exonuclease I